MIFNKLHKILWLTTIVTLWTNVFAVTGITGMKALVLYTENPLDSVTEALNAYGIEYEEWNAEDIGENEKLTSKLYDKRPLFYMIIIDGSLEIYNNEKQIWESTLTLSQWTELDEYEARNHVRRVVVNNYPKPTSNNDEWGGYEKEQILPQKIVCADNNMTQKIFNDARVRRSAPLTSEGLVHSNIQNSKDSGVIPILYFKPNDLITEKTLAAAIFDIGDGREVFSFFLQFTPESTTVSILNHLWINWASRGLLPGYRRIFFNPQVENVFLSTHIVDDSLPGNTDFQEALTKSYRATASDYQNILQFMDSLASSKKLNDGSSLKIELVFNGKGILDAQDSSSSNNENEKKKRSTSDESFTPTNKTERDLFIEEANKYWDVRHASLVNDEVFRFFSDLNHRSKFNWVSNTYANSVLLDASEKEIVEEILKNIESAMHLGLVSRHLENSEMWWSKSCMGTRGSLGFTDVKVAGVLKKYNIHYGLGNKLREDIVHPTNPYLPWSSVLGDFQVIPRDKRLSLRWASSPLESIWLHNKFHTVVQPEHEHVTEIKEKERREKEIENANGNISENELSEWLNILESESNEAVQSLLKLRHEPFVFNQSNLRVKSGDSNDTSILAQWIDLTLQKLTTYVYWPIVSSKSDYLANYYHLRALKKECGAEVHYAHNDTHILSIEVSSSQPCRVPITVTAGVVQDASDPALTFEKLGNDPLTVWVDVPGDNTSKILHLRPPLSYLDRSIAHFASEEPFEPDSSIEGDEEEDNDAAANDVPIIITGKNIKMTNGGSNINSSSSSSNNNNIKDAMEKILMSGRSSSSRESRRHRRSNSSSSSSSSSSSKERVSRH